jgi:hypothetical protein
VGSATYVVNAVNEGIVTAVAHRQPIAAEPDDVDVSVPEGTQQLHISYRRNPPLQLSIQCTYKWPNSKPHGATRQQMICLQDC